MKTKSVLFLLLSVVLFSEASLADKISGIAPIGSGTSGIPGNYPNSYFSGPCDIAAAAGTPCVAAHSVTRRLLGSYTGPLFELQRTSDSTLLNVYPYFYGLVNLSAVSTFCSGTTCNYAIVYDETANGNNLPITPSAAANQPQYVVSGITGLPVVVSDMNHSNSASCDATCTYLRNRNATTNIPTGNSAITIYYAHTGENSSMCAGDYGNVEATVADTGDYHMFELVYWTPGGTCGAPSGAPQPGIDRENGGIFANGGNNPLLFTTIAKNDLTNLTIKYGTFGNQLIPIYKQATHVFAMEGGLSIGEGGDGTAGYSAFEEGAVIAAATSDATDNAIQANINAFYTVPVNTCSLAYCGVGDVYTAATVKGWYGLRAYSQATRGTKAIHVCLPLDVTCIDMLSDAVTGQLIITTIGGTACNNTTSICTADKIYEQSGGGAPDLSQATIASRPILVLNCTPNGQPCLAGTNVQSLLSTAGNPSLTQPITMAGVFQRTGGNTSFSDLIFIGNTGNANNLQFGGWNQWNKIGAGRDNSADGIPATASDTFFNSYSVTFNGSSSAIHINGGNIPISISSNNPANNTLAIGSRAGGATGLVGKYTETGIWSGSISASQAATLSANQRAFYGL